MEKRRTSMGNIRIKNGALFFLAASYILVNTTEITAEQISSKFSYDDYDLVLKANVNDNGMVNYKQLKQGRGKLDTFVVSLGDLDTKSYEKWNREQKISFWLNAYNALTLKAVIDNYPIKSSWVRSLKFPKNSIRQIAGVWDELKFNVMGADTTLNDIEHKILRKEFDEPRIHMAMVCAAMGCPPLRNEPYIGEKLDEQLNDQTRKFLGNNNKFRIDYKSGSMYLSPIFKWFAGDFVKTSGMEKKYRGHKGPLGAVIKFIDKHLPEEIAQKRSADSRTYKILYLH